MNVVKCQRLYVCGQLVHNGTDRKLLKVCYNIDSEEKLHVFTARTHACI